jgi:hypothetical protein
VNEVVYFLFQALIFFIVLRSSMVSSSFWTSHNISGGYFYHIGSKLVKTEHFIYDLAALPIAIIVMIEKHTHYNTEHV